MANPHFFIGVPLAVSEYEKYEARQEAIKRFYQACFDHDVDQLLDLRNEFDASSDDVLKAEVTTIDLVLSRINAK